MPRTKKTADSYFDRIESDIKNRQSTLSLVLGALIVVVVGLLVYNYFNKDNSNLGPSQQTQEQTQGDVSPENLPGKYTVKEGDTLFIIADKYYKDGYKFTEIAKANNLTDVNNLEVGQVLEIPKLETSPAPSVETSPTSSVKPSPAVSASPIASVTAPVYPAPAGEKGTTVSPTTWGLPITGDTYTVVKGDWLSKIAGRAYGNILDYKKIAEANNITNPDLITPGMVLKIPR